MIPTLEALQSAMLISSTDRHFAKEMGRVGGEARPLALAAIALASRETTLGHTCLALDKLSRRDAWAGLADEFEVPETSAWQDVLTSSPLVETPEPSGDPKPFGGEAFDDTRPMVLDAAGRLYLRRYWVFQGLLADQLRMRAAEPVSNLDEVRLARDLDRFFGPVKSTSPERSRAESFQTSFNFDSEKTEPAEINPETADGQRLAAELAVRRKFCVISGGPGTGKTATAGKILALIVEQAVARAEAGAEGSESKEGEVSFPRIALVAPTGKAAATLAKSINEAVSKLDCLPEIRAAIPTTAQTIHRCLGVRGGALPGFRHHAGNPLPIDLLLVDEASMVDLALMTRLLSAVPDAAQVILLGDEHQLASVETGAVLGDICGVVASDESLAPAGDSGLGDCIARLTHSYRYDPESGIGALARAINRGDVAAALEVLDSPNHPEVARFDLDARGPAVAQLQRDVIRGFGAYLADRDPERMLAGFSRFRILSPLRRGPGGVYELNRSIEAILRREEMISRNLERYPGRPLLINTNDYSQQLFNGDVGIVVPEADGVVRVVFPSVTGSARSLAYSRLPNHETAFAMTVHKSQGSEFDEVAIVLTDFAAIRTTRELLYTAVTRARSKVTLYGSRDAVAQTIGREVERASGLGDALRSLPGVQLSAEVASR